MKSPRQSYLEFTKSLEGFDYFSKKSGNQVFRWQLYGTGLTAEEIKEKYDLVIRKKNNSDE
jgi:methylglyoxal synthase